MYSKLIREKEDKQRNHGRGRRMQSLHPTTCECIKIWQILGAQSMTAVDDNDELETFPQSKSKKVSVIFSHFHSTIP